MTPPTWIDAVVSPGMRGVLGQVTIVGCVPPSGGAAPASAVGIGGGVVPPSLVGPIPSTTVPPSPMELVPSPGEEEGLGLPWLFPELPAGGGAEPVGAALLPQAATNPRAHPQRRTALARASTWPFYPRAGRDAVEITKETVKKRQGGGASRASS